MSMTSSLENDSPPLSERLNDPDVARALNRLLDRVDQVAALLDHASAAQKSAPNLLATLVDLGDSIAHKAASDGVDLEQRAQGLFTLMMRLSEPETIQAADRLLAGLPKLAEASQLLAEAPNIFATLMDVLDEWATQLKAEDIDVETSIRQGLHAALWLGARISETELERLGVLLRSDVLDEHAVEAVAMAGTALAKCQAGACELSVPGRVGIFGLLSALRNPDTQRALAFGLRFSQCFGNSLNRHDAEK
jgi:uncharacterized protein YjgD (DUF1641 family)